VAEPSASNAGQRPVSRRQALAYGSSLAAALPPHPPRPLRPGTGGDRLRSTCRLAWRRPSASWPPPSGAPDRSACRCSWSWSTTAAWSRCRRGWTAIARPASPWFA